MGRNNIAKPKNKKPKPSNREMKLINKAAKEFEKAESERSRTYFNDMMKAVMPVAEWNAIRLIIYVALEELNLRFGFGKDRLNRFIDGCLNTYECIAEGYVHLPDMVMDMEDVIGRRLDFSEYDMVEKYVEEYEKQTGKKFDRSLIKNTRREKYEYTKFDNPRKNKRGQNQKNDSSRTGKTA